MLTGIYAVATTIAKTSAGTFTTAESASHTRQAEIAATIQPAKTAKAAADAACAHLEGPEKARCHAATESATDQFADSAYQSALNPAVPDGGGAPRATYKIDIALYRAHRQWPD
ncbi:MAG: hypothetical protein ABI648_15540 [Betaproteobacteria bacterium]